VDLAGPRGPQPSHIRLPLNCSFLARLAFGYSGSE
jgi:hypothetical protein